MIESRRAASADGAVDEHAVGVRPAVHERRAHRREPLGIRCAALSRLSRRSRTCADYLTHVPLAEFGTHEELQLLVLLVSAAALLLLAEPLRIPYPILLVLGGLVLGFAPGVPDITLPPDVVLVGILPPLLYSAAYNTGLRELRQNLRPISLLAIGLVAATTVSVGAVAHYVIGLSWPAALRARRGRLADRSARGDGDRPPPRRAAAPARDHRGREPRQRRHRARAVQVRRRGGRHRHVLARCMRACSFVWTVVGGVGDRARRSATRSGSSAAGSTTRRSRS